MMVPLPRTTKKPCVSRWRLKLRPKPQLQLNRKRESALSRKPAAKRRKMPSVVAKKRRDNVLKKKRLNVRGRPRRSRCVFVRCTMLSVSSRSRSATSN